MDKGKAENKSGLVTTTVEQSTHALIVQLRGEIMQKIGKTISIKELVHALVLLGQKDVNAVIKILKNMEGF